MEYVLSYAMVFAELFSLSLLADSFFLERLRSRFARGAAIAIFSLVSFGMFMFVFKNFSSFPKILCALFSFFLFLCISYRALWKEFLLLGVVFYVFLCAIDNCIMLLSMSFFQYSYPALINDKGAYICGAYASKLIELTACLLFNRIRKAKKDRGAVLSPTSWFYLLLTPIFSLIIDLSIVTHAILQNDVGTWVILITVGLLFCNIAVVFLWNQLEREQRTLLENELLRQRVHSDQEKVSDLSAAYCQQRQQTHDFKSHMKAVEALLSAGSFDRALDYVRNWTANAQQSPQAVVHTNNPLVDALLNQKYQQAKEQGISVSLLADDLENLPIGDADFVTVLSNLLDNAIEAAAQCEQERAIHIKMQSNGNGKFILSVRNTSQPVHIIGETIQTTKPDPMAHGFGLANVKRIVAKNGGVCCLSQKEGWVQFTVSLPQNIQFTP